MPDESMAPKYLPVSRREVCDDITLSVAVCVLGWFCICDVSVTVQSVLNIDLSQNESRSFRPTLPFLSISGRDLTEFVLVRPM